MKQPEVSDHASQYSVVTDIARAYRHYVMRVLKRLTNNGDIHMNKRQYKCCNHSRYSVI
jgi:hypothetical protein